ncbi:MAG: hypothetical protein IIC53_08220 [Proteobacteria bacterium]|nr:hypothetical protein [Pseudomonadota bacterium]
MEVPNAAVEEQGIAEAVAPTPTKATGPGYEFLVPDHWQAYVGTDAATSTVVPADGASRSRRGRTSIRRGILAGYFAASGTLTEATQSFIENLQLSNSRLIPDPAQQKNFHTDHIRAESNFLVGPSTAVRGERENLWVVTAQRPQGLFYLVMISPVDEYGALYPGFQRALSSLRFPEE